MNKISRDRKGKLDNSRRIELINKLGESSLTKKEEKELKSLQARFEQWLAKHR